MTSPDGRQPLYLLTTAGCSLCDKAKQALWQPMADRGLGLIEVDIVNHEYLLSRFATSIPVVSLTPAEAIDSASPALAWPFDAQSVTSWLAGQL